MSNDLYRSQMKAKENKMYKNFSDQFVTLSRSSGIKLHYFLIKILIIFYLFQWPLINFSTVFLTALLNQVVSTILCLILFDSFWYCGGCYSKPFFFSYILFSQRLNNGTRTLNTLSWETGTQEYRVSIYRQSPV